MEEIKALILEVSNSDSPVMIYGETGTGKEMIAESIHSEGKRRAKNVSFPSFATTSLLAKSPLPPGTSTVS